MAPNVKVCGITRVEDAELAVELGAWAVGMIFHVPSPRHATPIQAARVASTVRRRTLVTGVFVNHPLDEIARLHDRVGGFDLIQLHGDEGPSFCAEAARQTGARIVKAVRVASRADVQALDAFRSVDFHLLDAEPGQTVEPWLAETRRSDVPLLLAGGLTPENVAEAIAAVDPFGVDVARGTEAKPGIKDPERMRAFFAAAAGEVPAT